MDNKITTKFVLGLLVTILSIYLFFIFKFIKPVYYWIDNPLHIAGGIWVAAFTLWFLERYQDGLFLKHGKLVPFLFVLGMASLVGISWELFEFFYDQTVGGFLGGELISQPSIVDTMKDFVNNLSGALFFWGVYLLRK